MSRQFSLATVFRMTTNELLQQFFEKLGNPCWSMDWNHRPRRHVESVAQCLTYFLPEDRAAAELVLRQVFDLACPTGFTVVHSLLAGTRWERQFPQRYNLYCQALWLWLNAPKLFEQACFYHQVDHLTWWRKRDDLPRVRPATDAETLEMFAHDLTGLLSKAQGRGHRCTVEHFHRDDGTDYYFCYPDDYLRTMQAHDRRGRLVLRTIKPTFEIIFAYRREAGTLELYAKLPTRLKSELEEIFAWRILEERLGERLPRPVYRFDRLKDRGFRLETDPTDEIFVELRRLQLLLPDRTRIVLEPRWVAADDIPGLINLYLNQNRFGADEVTIWGTTFRFHFRQTPQRARGRMTFDVAAPNTCSLRTHRPERVEIAQKYLKLWSIARD